MNKDEDLDRMVKVLDAAEDTVFNAMSIMLPRTQSDLLQHAVISHQLLIGRAIQIILKNIKGAA